MRKPKVSSLKEVDLQAFKSNHYIIDLRRKVKILEVTLCNLGSINVYLLLYFENEISRMFVNFFYLLLITILPMLLY